MIKRMVAPILIGVAGVAVLVSLGTWQMQRLTWKEGVLAEIAARITAEPVAVPAAPDPEVDRYLPVIAQGEIADAAIRVLVSTREDGAGYRIISPFDMGDRTLLIDRGFIPAEDPVPGGGPAEVAGNLHWPDEVNRSTPENDLMGNIWFARDVAAMAAHLGTEPVLIIAREVTPGYGPRPMPVGPEGIPNDHLEYAVTWFSLAMIWFVMTLYLLWRIRQKTV